VDKKDPLLYSIIIEGSKKNRSILFFVTAALFPIVYLVVYFTGGTQYAYLHIMYIPVILTAFLYGLKGGVFAGIFAGVLLGPLMPLDTVAGTPQPVLNWIYRMVYFMLIGGVVGFILENLRDQVQRTFELHTRSPETGIVNHYHYRKHHDMDAVHAESVVMSVQINNYEALIILLGREAYNRVFMNFHKVLLKVLPKRALIFQVDTNRFWVEMPAEDFKDVRDALPGKLEKETFYSENVPLYLSFSIGTSLPAPGKSVHARFQESDVAAMHAKNHGLRFVVYHEDYQYDELLIHRLGELPVALKENRFFLEYQPIIDLETETVVGVEALIRWQYGDKTLYPQDFIPLAEETRIIDEITLWVFDTAFNDFESLKEIAPGVDMAVNISQKNLLNPDIVEKVRNRIRQLELSGRNVHIEMTESAMMTNRTSTSMFLSSFKDLNVKTIMDDFGTGYSSLSCLRDLPVDTVKIDREFTLNIDDDISMRYMVESIIDLAHNLDLKVIAEGVEDASILERLQELGCDYVQGYYYARPMRWPDLVEWLKDKTLPSD